ncbi:hypothetical protein QQP08_015150 [Theobroma cacao]|nr:hypothetical protein QQP08_015150 [Theobroma cacao]
MGFGLVSHYNKMAGGMVPPPLPYCETISGSKRRQQQQKCKKKKEEEKSSFKAIHIPYPNLLM